MSQKHASEQKSWWNLVLTGVLAIAFGVAAIMLPGRIMFGRILDVIFGEAKPLSGSMTAVAIFLALIALVAIDGLINLVGPTTKGKQGNRLRGALGIAVAAAAVLWPGKTAYGAVELIGVWAVLIGVLELSFGIDGDGTRKDRTLMILAASASIVVGVGVMLSPFAGALLVSAMVGVGAAARGISLIISGIAKRPHRFHEKQAISRRAA